MSGNPSASAVSCHAFQMITMRKETGLGVTIVGGMNHNEGPLVYIQDIIPGGDCHEDGRLKPGDQLVSINKESLIGVSFEEAKHIIMRAKLRPESTWEIAFIRQNCPDRAPEGPRPAPLSASSLNHEQPRTSAPLNVLPPQVENPALSSGNCPFPDLKTAQEAGFKTREPFPVTSSNNSLSDASSTDLSPEWPEDCERRGKKISLNPSVRFHAKKLETALNYLGIQPTEEQHQALSQQVPLDPKGMVSFGDFVQVARNLFSLHLDEGGVELRVGEKSVQDLSSLLDSELSPYDPSEVDDVERLKSERSDALKEVKKLKEELLESENQRKQMNEELQNVKQEAKAAVEEARALRSRVHLAEAAQMQARGVEMDYEELIRLLEAEMAQLKIQLADRSDQNQGSVQDLRKRIKVLDCQLRKSEMSRRTLEVAAEKLLQFAEAVHEIFSDSCSSSSNLSDRRVSLPSQTLLPRLGKKDRVTPAAVAVEAKELAESVRAILEVDCLPYGWEEAYTADGIKYFINHVTQTTSWTHPVAGTLSWSCPEESGDEGPRERYYRES
ncbi:syntaxin-binding protein 4 isoform X2 [Tachyglossus aculeatus]|uniref:syntaxin-binding protein 4 isoform X2 n=1 Tax=Tachyglossus aculeatus TaxID=9261 RepID=UPI0018F30D11|nr:syntaxin-binding protein 4 isoform X2 [Tachyglossus aculeatus]